MQLIKKHEKEADIVFYIGIAIHLLLMVVGYGDWSIPFHGRWMKLAFGLFGIKILMTYYTKAEWGILILLGMIGALSYIATGDEYVVSVLVMIAAAKNVDMKRVCKWIFVTALLATIIIAVLSLFGIGGMAVDIRDYGRGGVEARWCFGFGHANNIHGTLWYLTALLTYLYFEKMNWKHYAVLTLLNVVLFYFTASKGGLIAMELVIVGAALLRYCKELVNAAWIYVIGALAVIGVCVLSFVSVSIEWLKSPILMLLDRVFTGRINLAYQHANIRMWKLLSCAGEFGDPVDNGWVTIFFNYGYVIGIVFILLHLYLLWTIWKQRNGVLLVIVVTNIFYTFMESSYTMNSSYLLSNLVYVSAMIIMAGRGKKENEPERLEA